jgi:hypothetical protein
MSFPAEKGGAVMTTAMITPRKPGRLTCLLAQAVLALVAVCCWVGLAIAATVTPSDRVTSYLVVRNQPSSDGLEVGRLKPGEKAETIQSVPRWLKVRLSDGTVGYVSKAWVEEVEVAPSPGAPPATPAPAAAAPPPNAPAPLLETGHPVDWWFVFKFNTNSFPECGDGIQRQCPFGGQVQNYHSGFGQQFVYASSEAPTLQKGAGCVGETTTDPLGATFAEVYNGTFHYVVWNDQFYDDPKIDGCKKSCGGPWGHSKGLLAWNDTGDGLVLQVTTPDWPAAGSARLPRKTDGNTLGCIANDDDVLVSQHFFALKLTKDDLVTVLKALENASVVTDPSNRQIVDNGGPADVQTLVTGLGIQSLSHAVTKETLSTGVVLISKPSALHVPPWQMVSSLLDSVPLRTATWWACPYIYSTTAKTKLGCWDGSLGTAGSVGIATTGQWDGTTFVLTGGSGPDFNHAKIGVSTSSDTHYAIFGDMNQQGSITAGRCASSQDGRGGLFYVVNDERLHDSVADLIKGETAGTTPDPKKCAKKK